MATQTPNLGLTKPQGSDYVRVEDFNGNADVLDETIGDMGALKTQQRGNLVGAMNEVISTIVKVVSVDKLPSSPDADTLYLIRDYRDLE